MRKLLLFVESDTKENVESAGSSDEEEEI